ncbi:MAG TPA: hypothetical protein VNW30_01915 [Opitutaceae bacterium]|jgi:hypothetical protein|nr:hypothetical protein [Opitutaceae bacterium]
MREDEHKFLILMGHPPARLCVEQVAWVLGCQLHDVPDLISSGLLKPLGNPQPNAIKFFSTEEVLELIKDRSWLAKVTNEISRHWHRKNARKKVRYLNGAQPVLSSVRELPAASGFGR